MPPCSVEASPSEETSTSSVVPVLTNGGSLAVTITAATFLLFSASGGTAMPSRCSMLAMVCGVNGLAVERSPVPLSPTMSP